MSLSYSVTQSVVVSSTELGFQDQSHCPKASGLLMGSILSDEKTGLSFAIAAGLRQLSHSRVRVAWDLRPYSNAPEYADS
jgi:hypothetical protein